MLIVKLLTITTLACVTQGYRHFLDKRAGWPMPGRWCHSCEYDRENAGNGEFSHSCPTKPIHATALVGTTFCTGDRDYCGRKVITDQFNDQETIWLGCISDEDFDECKTHMPGSSLFNPDTEYKERASSCTRCNTDLCNGRDLNVVHYKIDELHKAQPQAVVPANRGQADMGGPRDRPFGPPPLPASNMDMPMPASNMDTGADMRPMSPPEPSFESGPEGLPHLDSQPGEESGPADGERA